jgi:hypothetical protein
MSDVLLEVVTKDARRKREPEMGTRKAGLDG